MREPPEKISPTFAEEIRGEVHIPSPAAVLSGLAAAPSVGSCASLSRQSALPWKHGDLVLNRQCGQRWGPLSVHLLSGTAVKERYAVGLARRTGWVADENITEASDKEAVKFLEPKIHLCDERLATTVSSTTGPNKWTKRLLAAIAVSSEVAPSNDIRRTWTMASAIPVCSRRAPRNDFRRTWTKNLLSGKARLSARKLRLCQAMGMGSWGLAVREVVAASALAAPQRRLLCEFLGFEEAAILQSEAWDQLILVLLPRLLPAKLVMVPRWRCAERLECPCNRRICWCCLRCPCESAVFLRTPSHATCWQTLRRSKSRQLYSLQLEAPCLLIPESMVAGGVPVKADENTWRFLCRHSDPATAAQSWARLSMCTEESQRRERLNRRRRNISSRSVAIHRQALTLAGIKDTAVVNGAVQVGLLRNWRHWEARLDALGCLFGVSADALCESDPGYDDPDVLRLRFRPVREKPAGPSWLHTLEMSQKARRRLRRLHVSLPSTTSTPSTRLKRQSEVLREARCQLEKRLSEGWALRKARMARATDLFRESVEEHEEMKAKNDRARLAQQGLVRPHTRDVKKPQKKRKAHYSALIAPRKEARVTEEVDVPSSCEQGDWKALFGEPPPGEALRSFKACLGDKLKELLQKHPPELRDALCRAHKAAMTAAATVAS